MSDTPGIVKRAVKRLDFWYNKATGQGGPNSAYQQRAFHSKTHLPRMLLDALWLNSWLAERIVRLPVDQALKNGFGVEGKEDALKKFRELNYADARHPEGLYQAAAYQGRLYGGAALILGVTGSGQSLKSPLVPGRGSLEWIALEQQYKVLNDVRRHFYRTLGQQQLVQIQRELLKTAQDALLTRREQYNVGQANSAEVHMANVELQQQRLAVLAAENMLRASWQSVTALAGVDLPRGTLVGSLESGVGVIEWNQALNRLLVESPQIQAALAKLEADRVQLERELVQSVPNLAVTTGAGQDFTSTPSRAVGYARLELDLPIWNRNEGTVREARSDLARQQAEIRRVELQLRDRLAGVYGRYITAMQHVHNFQAVILVEAQKAYAVGLDSYGRDRLRWSDVLTAQRDYFRLRAKYVEHLVQLRESEVVIVGYLLQDGLKAPPNPVPPGHINVNPQPR